MSYDSVAIANGLLAVLQGLPGLAAAQIGVPDDPGYRVSAYVTMGSIGKQPKASGVTQRESRFFVVFVYRVGRDEVAAELALMALVDAFMAALDADRTLGGVARAMEAESVAADEPIYQLRVGQEYREYPMTITARQYGAYAVNP